MVAALASILGERIRNERARRCMSLSDLADCVPCDRQLIWQWEHGVLPTLPSIYSLAMALEMSPAELLPSVQQVAQWRGSDGV